MPKDNKPLHMPNYSLPMNYV